MSEKAANVQMKTLKDLQKAWRTIAQDHFKRLQEILAPWRHNIETTVLQIPSSNDRDPDAGLLFNQFYTFPTS